MTEKLNISKYSRRVVGSSGECSGNIVYDLTDHLANFIILNNLGSLPSNIKVYKRDYSNFNQSALISEMQSIDWHSIFTSDSNPSDMFCSFYSTISEKVDKHIPLKQLSKKVVY